MKRIRRYELVDETSVDMSDLTSTLSYDFTKSVRSRFSATITATIILNTLLPAFAARATAATSPSLRPKTSTSTLPTRNTYVLCIRPQPIRKKQKDRFSLTPKPTRLGTKRKTSTLTLSQITNTMNTSWICRHARHGAALSSVFALTRSNAATVSTKLRNFEL